MHIIHFCFEAEEKTPVDRYVLVDIPDKDKQAFGDSLMDSMDQYMDKVFEGTDYEYYDKAVEDVMNATGRKWIPVDALKLRI